MSTSISVFELISAAVGIIGLTSIVIAWLQLRDTAKWNRQNAAYTYFPSGHDLADLESALDDTTKFFTRPKTQPLTDLEAKALHGEALDAKEIQALKRICGLQCTDAQMILRLRDAGRHLKHYLSILERYSLAINKGLVDGDIARELFQSKFRTHFVKAEAYIRYAQRKADGAYCEFEAVVDRWTRRSSAGTDE